MNIKRINLFSTVGSTAVCAALLIRWFTFNPVGGVEERVPGMDNRPVSSTVASDAVEIGSYFAEFSGIPARTNRDWPRFRGSDYDNIGKEGPPLADGWDDGAPPLLWSVELGEGHAGPVIANGRVYVLDYDESERADILRCFSFEDGREIWRRGYELYVKRNHGMSRTVPAATADYVVSIGPKCHVMCLDALAGDLKWGIDLVREYGAEVPLWYTGQCPLITDSTAIFAVGGDCLIMAVRCETGEVVWSTPNLHKWKMSHSSIMPMAIQGRRMYVYCAIGGMVGVAADGEDAGRVLFETAIWNHEVIAPSPVYVGDGRILLTAGYGAGSMMLKVSRSGESFTVDSLQTVKPEGGLASEQQTPLWYRGHLFAILPKDAGAMRNQFICCSPDDLSRIVWSSGRTERFGLGPYLIADDKFYILSDDGVLTMAEASTREYRQLAQARILGGHDAWGPMAIADGKLLARDSRRLVCVDLRQRL